MIPCGCCEQLAGSLNRHVTDGRSGVLPQPERGQEGLRRDHRGRGRLASATASVPVPAPARVDPPRAAPPAVDPIPADPGLPDETTFVLPDAWARRAEPFRGLRPAPKLAIDVAATRAEADALRQRAEPLVQEVLAHPSSDPAGRAHRRVAPPRRSEHGGRGPERARRHRGCRGGRPPGPLGRRPPPPARDRRAALTRLQDHQRGPGCGRSAGPGHGRAQRSREEHVERIRFPCGLDELRMDAPSAVYMRALGFET